MKKNNLPIIIPLSLLVIMGAIIPIIAFAQTAGSGGTNTPFIPTQEFNPILTPINPVTLNSTSTFFDDWCEINESGNNVDAGTWICFYNIEQMYDDIITLWNDEATVLQVELDEANTKIELLNNTVTTLQVELNALTSTTYSLNNSKFEWVISASTHEDSREIEYLDIQIENVWPQQRVFMKHVHDDGTLGVMYGHYANKDGIAVNSMQISHYIECYNFIIWTETQPFYTEYEHCLAT